MDSRMYPQGSGGLKGKYVSGVLTVVNGSGATVYTVNPSTKAVAFAGAVAVTGALTVSGAASLASLTVPGANAEITAALPTVDPSAAGQLWANSGIVTVSAG